MLDKKRSLRTRFFLFFLFVSLSLGLGTLYIYLSTNLFLEGMVTVFQRNRNLLELDDKREVVSKNLEDYLSSNNSDSLLAFWTSRDELKGQLSESLKNSLSTQERRIRQTVAHLMEAFLAAAEESLEAKRGRDFSRYALAFSKTERITQLVQWYISEQNLKDFRESIDKGSEFFQQINILFTINLLLIISLTGLTALSGVWFSIRLTEPLQKLAQAAQAFSSGDLAEPELPDGHSREILILSRAFKSMRINILSHISSLKEKAQVEQGLMNEKLKNLEISSLLKDAEFRALQAQINPHFLFNTLNAGIQLALMEEAEQTRKYMESLSAFMRYTVRGLDRPVQLRDELKHLEHYFFILRIRFGERYRLEVIEENPCPDLLCPGMIIQPLVENALLHGLKDKLTGGLIRVRVEGQSQGVLITVEDNGEGISGEILEALNRKKWPASPSPSEDSTGIGLTNVLNRIELFYSGKSRCRIESEPGEGVRVLLELPRQGSEK